jgi:hypothetical protein
MRELQNPIQGRIAAGATAMPLEFFADFMLEVFGHIPIIGFK